MSDLRPPRVNAMPGFAEYHRTVGGPELLSFTAATGDDNRIHHDATYAQAAGMADRIAHGILIQGLMSTACTRWAEREGVRILSGGWDRVRFLRPVIVGDTISSAYALEDPQDTGRRRRAFADAWNQRGELVAVGTHLLHIID